MSELFRTRRNLEMNGRFEDMNWYIITTGINLLDAQLEELSSEGISAGEKKSVTAMRRKLKDFNNYAKEVMKMSSDKRTI